MGTEEPQIFNVIFSMRMRYQQIANIHNATAKEWNIKILKYIMRCMMSDYSIYTITSSENIMVTHARRNFDRLLRECDVVRLIPRLPMGVIRLRIPMNLYPVSESVQANIDKSVFIEQEKHVKRCVSAMCRNFVIYTAAFGPSQELAFPTFSIILPRLDTVSVQEDYAECMRVLRTSWNVFDESKYVLRFAVGWIIQAGETYYYPRLPVGASISSHEPEKVPNAPNGTFTCYCTDKNNHTTVYGLTAGHIAQPILNPTISNLYAPATKPYHEAIVTTKSWITSSQRETDAKILQYWTEMHQELISLDRTFSQTLVSSTATDPCAPHIKWDYALLNVKEERIADNRLSKIPEFSENIPFDPDFPESDKLCLPISPIVEGDTVWKRGIRTALTQGVVIGDVHVRWDRESTTQVSPDVPDWQNIPVTVAPGVVGLSMQDSSFEKFADVGDSGASVIRFVREEVEEGETEREAFYVIRSECLGILYALVREDGHQKFVGVFLPITDVVAEIERKTGIQISLDVPDKEEKEWVFKKLGKGWSSEGLR